MNVSRLFDVIQYQAQNKPQEVSLAGIKNGQWVKYSTAEVIDLSNKLSLGLISLGIQPGDKVALVTTANRPEWNICDFAISQIGAINVPLYPTISPSEYEYILNHAEAKICIVSDEGLFRKVMAAKDRVPTLSNVYTWEEVASANNWTEVIQLGENGDLNLIKERSEKIQSKDLATIIYTSGTTGLPKGVMLSHENIISNLLAVSKELPIESGQVSLSFLPLCHIFERMVIYTYFYNGVNVYYSDVDTLAEKLQTVRPHFFTTVPRLLEKVYEKIVNKGLELKGLKKKLFFWALSLTDDYQYDQKPGLQMKIADKLIFSKWREALGGRVVGIVTGSAACPLKIARVFSAAGVPIREGYGLTETSPVITFNRFTEGGSMLGTVGMPIEKVEVKIAEDGEILAKGPNIMMGYFKAPDKTAEVMSGDWFHTGDVGTFLTGANGNKFLKITDRKKELLKTSGGKYVAPAPIESLFRESFFIEQIMVVGEGKKFVSALIIPAYQALHDWAREKGLSFKNNEELIKNDQVVKLYEDIVKEINPNFNHIEQIKKFKLLANEWTVDTKELTPTMKIKRKVITEKYAREIGEIYGE
ncbi:MAG: long-chain fatty acid--CoA ligase [Chitinophagales bacterium]|nr:long-chain fatty acid--CoA ligase [Chitinophagales bacterium]MCZ2394554.1 long-chain fatty acid--CoA ligase [Chitinophagales bacterium]